MSGGVLLALEESGGELDNDEVPPEDPVEEGQVAALLLAAVAVADLEAVGDLEQGTVAWPAELAADEFVLSIEDAGQGDDRGALLLSGSSSVAVERDGVRGALLDANPL